MSILSRFPQGQVLDESGYISLEWQEWLQNPEFTSITLDTPLPVTSGGTGAATSILDSLQMAGPILPATPLSQQQFNCQIWAGVDVPDNAGGMNGDFYFRADGAPGTNIYKKSAGLWAAIL